MMVFIVGILHKYANFSQSVYDRMTLWLLDHTFSRKLVIEWHRFLLLFRLNCEETTIAIGGSRNLSLMTLGLTYALKPVHGYMAVLILFLLRLNFSYGSMSRFYQTRTKLFETNFPEAQDPKHRMQRAAKVLAEAAQNPYVKAAAVAGVGMCGWKALDVLDTTRAAEQAEKDRQHATEEAEKDRQHATEEAVRTRQHATEEAEKDRVESRKAAAEEVVRGRVESRKAAAFDKINSAEYESLSEAQKKSLEHALETGEYL